MNLSSVFGGIFMCGILCPVYGAVIGGVEFPQGSISFADAVVSYTPGLVGSNPTTPHRASSNAVGLPDYAGGNACSSQANCKFVSLGDGGSIILRFIDNQLTGNGSASPDLWVFEVGPDVEDTFVAVSDDGVAWNPVGKVFGSTAGVDLDAFGFDAGDSFSYVRLTDDSNEGGQNGATVGADIDAVGAISTIPSNPVPEPATGAISAVGILLAGWWARRRSPSGIPSKRLHS